MEKILNNYISELKNKILLKGITNKNETEILFQAFKYYDSNSNGFCNFDTFIKVNQKMGVTLPNPQDFQHIFSIFDLNNEGMINYNEFIDKIFKPTSKNIKNKNSAYNPKNYKNNNIITNKNLPINNKNKKYSKTNYFSAYNNEENKNIFKNNNNKEFNSIPPYKKPFFDKIVNSILFNEIGPGVTLLLLHQGFILGDNNFINQITIEEFIKIINDNNIDLSISDIQMLFHSYELNNDGFFYYEEMFNDLINIYWNNQRERFSQRKSEEIINLLNKKGRGKFQLFLLQNIIQISNNSENFFWKKLNIYDTNEYYGELIKKYLGLKRIMNCPKETLLASDDLVDIMKYISFGIKSNQDFNKAINIIFNSENYNNYPKNNDENDKMGNSLTPKKNNKILNKFREKNNLNNYINDVNQNENFSNSNIDFFSFFHNYFMNKGIIIFLNFLKSFQNYEANPKQITKNNFIKILKDFKISCPPNIISGVFLNFFKNNKYFNYILFISKLLERFSNTNIINITSNIYDQINDYCLYYSGKNMNIDFFKNYFNINNNYFFVDKNNCLNNILIVFERFHYDFYEKFKGEEKYNNTKDIYNLLNEKIVQIDKKEFIWFYKFLYFFINEENIFKNVIINDWKIILNLINENNNTDKTNTNINNNENTIIIHSCDDNKNINVNKNINMIIQTPILMNIKNNIIENKNNNTNGEISIENINNTKNNNACKLLSNNTISNDIIYNNEKKEEKNKTKNTKDDKIQKNNIIILTPLQIICIKLKKRGIRGVMNLHKQFIISCKDLSTISYDEFLKVLSYQRLSLPNEEYKNLFLSFTDEKNQDFLDFTKFIRAFKKILNKKRLSIVENIFTKLDINKNDSVSIDDIKKKYFAKDHPLVASGKKDEEEILCEFLDCFDLNYYLLITKENKDKMENMVNFEEFANFYEYVSFLYDNDDDFIQLVNNSWKTVI